MKLYCTKPHPELVAGYHACLNAIEASRTVPDWRDYHKNPHHLFVVGWERVAAEYRICKAEPNLLSAKTAMRYVNLGRDWYALGSMPAPHPDLLPAARAGWETARAFDKHRAIDWSTTLAWWMWSIAIGILLVIGVNKLVDYCYVSH